MFFTQDSHSTHVRVHVKYVKDKKACINVKNDDLKISKYKNHKDNLKFDKINFPIQLKDIPKFEKLNNINIAVIGCDKVENEKEENDDDIDEKYIFRPV